MDPFKELERQKFSKGMERKSGPHASAKHCYSSRPAEAVPVRYRPASPSLGESNLKPTII